MFLCFTGLISTCIASSFTNVYWMFLTARLIIGLFQAGFNIQTLTMASELVTAKHRSQVITYICITFVVGSTMIGVQAWLIPNRKNLEIATSIPYIIGIILLTGNKCIYLFLNYLCICIYMSICIQLYMYICLYI